MVMFVGLNPSTADESKNDPTIRRCIRFATDWGFGGLFMMNAYAFRATDPAVMKMASDPVGPDNDAFLREYATKSKLVVAAWGVHCSDDRELAVLDSVDQSVHCLGTTKAGKPRHPLYIRSDTEPELYRRHHDH